MYDKMRSPRQPPSRWYASAGHSWPSSSGRHRLLDTSVVTLALPRVGEQMSSDLLGTLEVQSYVDYGYFVILKALLFRAEEFRPASRSGRTSRRRPGPPYPRLPPGRVDLRVA